MTIHEEAPGKGTVLEMPRVIVERVPYPHPEQVKWEVEAERRADTGRIEFDNDGEWTGTNGRRVWVEISARREVAADIDTDELLALLTANGAVEGSRVTLKITGTETVRAGNIAEVSHLRDKVEVYAENSGQEIPAGVQAKCDELEAAAAQRGGGEVSMKSFRFELGEVLKDKVTGFKGVVRSRADYLTGCNRYALQPRQLKDDGKPREWTWFDEDELVSTKDKTVVLVEQDDSPKHKNGGPLRVDQLPPDGR